MKARPLVKARRLQQKNPAARGEAKRRGRNREEANNTDDTSFRMIVYTFANKKPRENGDGPQ
jgi:hypothetical protein